MLVSNDLTNQQNMNQLLNSIHCLIKEEDDKMLMAQITEIEVKQAAFQLHPNKTLGPNRLPSCFYQKC
jgi:hypothetical protein